MVGPCSARRLHGEKDTTKLSSLFLYFVQAENDSQDEECKLMTMAESKYIKRLREIQLKKYPKIT